MKVKEERELVDVILARLEPIVRSSIDPHKIAPPFGILYVANSLEKAGFSVKLIHEEGTKENIHTFVNMVAREKPLFVGFSVITGPSIIPSMQASILIKRECQTPVVWGGLHPTMIPEQTLLNEFIDIVVMGEGEFTGVELVKTLREYGLDHQHLGKVKGIGFKSDGKVVITEKPPFIKNLDELEPAWHLLDFKKYLYSGRYFYSDFGSKLPGDRIAAIITSRGCPWKCGFCYNQFINKSHFRAKSADKVIKDIQNLKDQFDITAIIFEDDDFWANKERAIEIIRNIGIPWSASIRANYVANWREEFVKEIAKNNCCELRIGAESVSRRTLKLMEKDITVNHIRKAVKIARQHGIRVLLNFMIGIPGETWSDINETLDLIDELAETNGDLVISGPSVYSPFPGTPLFDSAIKHGYEPPKSLEEWGTRFWSIEQPIPPYADKRVKSISFYRKLAMKKSFEGIPIKFPAKSLARIAKFRWKRRYFGFPVDYQAATFLWNTMRKLNLAFMSKKLY